MPVLAAFLWACQGVSSDDHQTIVYGLSIEARRVVFVLDCSGSMGEASDYRPEGFKGGQASKMDVATFELRRAIEPLPEDALFTVIAFSTDVDAWRHHLVEGTDEHKKAAAAWIDKLMPRGKTDSCDALQAALQTPGPEKKKGPEAVVFISDGRPTAGAVTDPRRIRQMVRRLNSTRRIKIHCIAVGEERAASREAGCGVDPKFMQGLASDTGGSFLWKH